MFSACHAGIPDGDTVEIVACAYVRARARRHFLNSLLLIFPGVAMLMLCSCMSTSTGTIAEDPMQVPPFTLQNRSALVPTVKAEAVFYRWAFEGRELAIIQSTNLIDWTDLYRQTLPASTTAPADHSTNNTPTVIIIKP